MPAYPWLAEDRIDLKDTVLKVKAMKRLGVPYTSEQVATAAQHAERQAKEIAADLEAQGAPIAWDSELVALIAYLQRLGHHPPFEEGDAKNAGKAPLARAPAAPMSKER